MSVGDRIGALARTAAARWNDFWFVEGPAHGVALMRIGFGIFWLIRFLQFLPYVRLIFSDQGWHHPFIENPQGIVDLPTFVFAKLGQPVPLAVAWTLYVFTLGTIVCFTIGYRTRLALAAFTAMFVYYYALYMHMTNSSYDRMLLTLMCLLTLSPCGKAVSVDAWLAARDGEPFLDKHPLWAARLIAVQVAIVYFGTGVFKMCSASWDKGEVICTAMISEWGSELAYLLVRTGLSWGVYDLAVIGTILFELYAGFALFSPRLRRPTFVIGTFFHTQIWLVLQIPQFMFLPMTYFVFADPEWLRDRCTRIGDWIGAKLGKPAAPVAIEADDDTSVPKRSVERPVSGEEHDANEPAADQGS